jgi:hypothetical protein
MEHRTLPFRAYRGSFHTISQFLRICMKVFALAALFLAPAVAFANCSSAVMKICVITPLDTASIYEEPCAYTQCSTSDSVFEYLRFGDGSHARVDYTSDGIGLLEAEFRFATKANDRKDYADMPVTVYFTAEGELSIGSGDEGFLATRPCDDVCTGINADDFGQ